MSKGAMGVWPLLLWWSRELSVVVRDRLSCAGAREAQPRCALRCCRAAAVVPTQLFLPALSKRVRCGAPGRVNCPQWGAAVPRAEEARLPLTVHPIVSGRGGRPPRPSFACLPSLLP